MQKPIPGISCIQELAVVVENPGPLRIAPLANVSLSLLKLAQDAPLDIRLLALVSRGELVFCALLLAHANSTEFSRQPPVTGVEAAIRRLGSARAYAVLWQCGTAPPFAASLAGERLTIEFSHQVLASLTTARNLSRWAGLPEAESANLYLGAVLRPLALYLGLAQDPALSQSFQQRLLPLADTGFAGWTTPVELLGYELVSAATLRRWGMVGCVPDALEDAASGSPTSHAGKRLLAVWRLLEHRHSGQDEAQALAGIESALGALAPVVQANRLRLAATLQD